jgi:hypothetical protein
MSVKHVVTPLTECDALMARRLGKMCWMAQMKHLPLISNGFWGFRFVSLLRKSDPLYL